MASSTLENEISYKASSNVVSHWQYCAMRISADDTVDLAVTNTASDHLPAGILQNNDATSADKACNVRQAGTTKVKAGAAVTAPIEVTFNTSGRAIAVTSSSQFRLGFAKTSASNDGDIIEISLVGLGTRPAIS